MEKKETSTNRKGFNFYKSYWDSYKALTKDKERLEFLETICKIQFLEINLKDINPSSYDLKLLFSSIKHSLETSILGYCSQKGIDYNTYPCQGASVGAYQDPCQQVQVQVQEEIKYICANFEKLWKEYPSDSRRRKDECEDIYKKYCTSKEKEEEFSKALSNYKQSKKFKEGYIQNSITWFRDWKTWLDYTKEYSEEEKRMIARGLCLD
jgi:hypothetical protein